MQRTYACGTRCSNEFIRSDTQASKGDACGTRCSDEFIRSDTQDTLTRKKEYPPEKDVAGAEPRIGVFVCKCGINIAGVVNVPEVTEYAKALPNVVFTDNNMYTCSQDTQEIIKQKILETTSSFSPVPSAT